MTVDGSNMQLFEYDLPLKSSCVRALVPNGTVLRGDGTYI